jgi:hypothetical protein
MAKNTFRFVPGEVMLHTVKGIVLLAGVLCILSCDFPQGMGNKGIEDGKGSLSIVLPGGNPGGRSQSGDMARSVLSNDFISTLRYQITLTGPGETIERETAGGTVTVSLQPGEWTITVEGRDPSDNDRLVGTGSETTTVILGKPVSVIIKMYVDTGYEAGLTDIYVHNEAELRRIGTDFAIDGSKTFHLENDITLTQPWTPIGDDGDHFKALFDGHGHTVTVAAFSSGALAAEYMGFFGYTEGGEIKNLNVKYELNGTVNNTNTDYYIYAGGIAGRAEGTSISNARVSGSFTVSSSANSIFYIGGITGAYFNGTIENCHVTSVELRGGAPASVCAGGISGELQSNAFSPPAIKSSSFTGTVVVQSGTGSAYGGGITGQSHSGTIIACYAAGTVDVSSSSADVYAGGIAGLFSSGDGMVNCYAFTAVDANGVGNYLGGIAGSGYSGTISTSYAAGFVKGQGSSVYAGGVSGGYGNSGTIENCRVFLTILDGGASSDVHTLFAYWLPMSGTQQDNRVWEAIAITRGGTTYTKADSFSGLSLDSDKDIATFSPAEDYTDSDLVSDSYPGWDFGTGGDWKFISGYDFPVLSWQTSPPDLSALPDSFVIIWP